MAGAGIRKDFSSGSNRSVTSITAIRRPSDATATFFSLSILIDVRFSRSNVDPAHFHKFLSLSVYFMVPLSRGAGLFDDQAADFLVLFCGELSFVDGDIVVQDQTAHGVG